MRVIDIQHGPLVINDIVNEQKIKIFPNPVSHRINIQLSDKSMNLDIKIFDLNGKILKHEINMTSIDIGAFEKGIYEMKIKSGKH